MNSLMRNDESFWFLKQKEIDSVKRYLGVGTKCMAVAVLYTGKLMEEAVHQRLYFTLCVSPRKRSKDSRQ
jgi:hypothetical protein